MFSSISFKRFSVCAASVVQSKGRAVSRLMESFAADEGFHLGEDSSFSEEDERKVSWNSRSAPGKWMPVVILPLLTGVVRHDVKSLVGM